jgi:hypothetical protein
MHGKSECVSFTFQGMWQMVISPDLMQSVLPSHYVPEARERLTSKLQMRGVMDEVRKRGNYHAVLSRISYFLTTLFSIHFVRDV